MRSPFHRPEDIDEAVEVTFAYKRFASKTTTLYGGKVSSFDYLKFFPLLGIIFLGFPQLATVVSKMY